MMGLMAMLITGLVGSLFGFGVGASLLYSGIGLVVFMLLTAYDTQKLHQMYAYYAADSELAEKASVYGALTLYLDFITSSCRPASAGHGQQPQPQLTYFLDLLFWKKSKQKTFHWVPGHSGRTHVTPGGRQAPCISVNVWPVARLPGKQQVPNLQSQAAPRRGSRHKQSPKTRNSPARKAVKARRAGELVFCLERGRQNHRWIRPEPSPPARFSTSSAETMLKSPSMVCFRAEAAAANSTASWVLLPFSRA